MRSERYNCGNTGECGLFDAAIRIFNKVIEALLKIEGRNRNISSTPLLVPAIPASVKIAVPCGARLNDSINDIHNLGIGIAHIYFKIFGCHLGHLRKSQLF